MHSQSEMKIRHKGETVEAAAFFFSCDFHEQLAPVGLIQYIQPEQAFFCISQTTSDRITSQ